MKRLWLLLVLAAAQVLAQPTYTTITDTLYTPVGGILFSGTLQISAPIPMTASGATVSQWQQTITIRNGVLSVRLVPNDAVTQTGTSYVFRFTAASGTPIWDQYCTVPTSVTPLKVNEVCSSIPFAPPAGMAAGGILSGFYPNPTCPTCVIRGNNLSDLTSAPTARTNLGLATIASSGSASDLGTGTVPPARFPAPTPTTFGGVKSAAVVTGQVVVGIGLDGIPIQAAFTASDISGLAAIATSGSASDLVAGTVPPARLPTPTTSTLGGVDSLPAVANQFLTGITNAGGITRAQPTTADISGLAAVASSGSASDLGAGTLPVGRLPAVVVRADQINTFSGTGSADFTSALAFTLKTGLFSAIPGTCAPGSLYFATDVTAGQNIYECSSTNTWTQQLVQSAVVAGTANQVTATGPGCASTGTCTIALANNTVVPGHPTLEGITATGASGNGNLVFNTGPSFVNPNIGNATAGTLNKITFTQPTTSATLTIPDGVVLTGPPASATVATLGLTNTFSGRQNATGAISTAPIKAGTLASIPATCAQGDLYFATDASAGQNIYECASTNSWTQQVSGPVNTISGTANQITATGPGCAASGTCTVAFATNPIFPGHVTIEGTVSTAATGTGSVVFSNTPTLVTPNIGVATATSVNRLTITPPGTAATLTIPDGVTLTGPPASATVATLGLTNTFSGRQDATGASSTAPLKRGTLGALPGLCTQGDLYFATDATPGQQIYECSSTNNWTQQVASTATITGVSNQISVSGAGCTGAGICNVGFVNGPTIFGHPTIEGVTSSGATGTGNFVFSNGPTLVAPILGAATATTLNKLTLTQPATSATLTIPDGVVLTGPPASATVATLGLTNAFTGRQDATGAISTAPAKTGIIASIPATCTTGDLYFATDVIAGRNIYECTATNTWTQQSSGTSPNITGTANQITTAGAGCTGSGTCAISITNSPIIPGHPTIEGVTSTGATGSGLLVFGTSPVFTTPTLGVAIATSINRVTFTQPALSATLTIPDGVTFTGPPASATAATLGLAETFSGDKTFTGNLIATSAIRTAPFKAGTSLPGTCTIGDLYFKTDAGAGQNIYNCTASNTWTQESGTGVAPTGIDGDIQIKAGSALGNVSGFNYSAGALGVPPIQFSALNPTLGGSSDLYSLKWEQGSDGKNTGCPGWATGDTLCFPNVNMWWLKMSHSLGMQDYDNAAKTSTNLAIMELYAPGAGQRGVLNLKVNAPGVGDAQAINCNMRTGPTNSAGDEGTACGRFDMGEDTATQTRTLLAMPTQSTCGSGGLVLTGNITPLTTPQTFAVTGSTTGCNVGDWLVLDHQPPVFGSSLEEGVLLTGVTSGTLTARVKHAHAGGVAVTAATKLDVGIQGANGFGQLRPIRNSTVSREYSTGTVAVVGSTFIGTGTSWGSQGVFGGDIKFPCLISLNADTNTGQASGLRSWFVCNTLNTGTQTITLTDSYSGDTTGSGLSYKASCGAVVLGYDFSTDPLNPWDQGRYLYVSTQPSVTCFHTGDTIEQVAPMHKTAIGIQLITQSFARGAPRLRAGFSAHNNGDNEESGGYALTAIPFVFSDPSRPAWKDAFNVASPVRNGITFAYGVANSMLGTTTYPSYPSGIGWGCTGGSLGCANLEPETATGNFVFKTRSAIWQFLSGTNGNDSFLLDGSGITNPITLTVPNHSGTLLTNVDVPLTTLSRALPTTVGNEIHIGIIANGQNVSRVFEIFVSTDEHNTAKHYTFAATAHPADTDGVWAIVDPDSKDVVGSTVDFELEVLANNPIEFRLRRTVGTTAATATVAFNCYSPGTATYCTLTPTSTTSSPGAPTAHVASSGSPLVGGACRIRSGAGSPEAALTGNVCDTFLRTDGGASTTLYVKESGSGNTGWAAHGPGAGGSVITSGSPAAHQVAIFSGAAAITGVSIGTTDKPLVGVTGADPAFSKLTLTNPATSAILTVADGATLITSGAFSTTLTSTATTASTLPAGTHSLAPLDSPVFTGSPTFPGHIITSGTAPSISGCGSGASISGNDITGTVTLGTTPGTCTVTFASAYASTPHCAVSFQNGVMAYATATTAIATTATGLTGAFDYVCLQ